MDIAKRIFQVEARDATGATVLRRSNVLKLFGKLPRSVAGLEACAGAHYWARAISALGHDVRLIPPTSVKPFVKRGKKNHQVDAGACCEAVVRKSINFVPIKSVEQQGALMLHRVRQRLVEERTSVLGGLMGDKAILQAMKTNEDDTNTARAVKHDQVPRMSARY